MTETLKFEAELKTISGKSSAKDARRRGMLPAIIYGGESKEVMVNLPLNEFFTEYKKGNIQAKLVEIALGKKTLTGLVRSVQLHPVTDIPVHIDLQEVSKDTLVRVATRIKIINEDKCSAIKRGAVLNIVSRTIDILSSPVSIPNFIEIDVSNLIVGKSLHINDISLPEGIKPYDKSNFVLVTLSGNSDEDGANESEDGATAA
jgi:large subunit ribosomal protein L25